MSPVFLSRLKSITGGREVAPCPPACESPPLWPYSLVPTTLYAVDPRRPRPPRSTRPTPSPRSSTGTSPPTGRPAASSPPSPADDARVRPPRLPRPHRPRAEGRRDARLHRRPEPRQAEGCSSRTLLTMPGHAGHIASVTRAAWLPQTLTNIQFASAGFQFENWLRIKFRDNTPADEVVRRLAHRPVHGQRPEPAVPVRAGEPERPGRFSARRVLPGQRGARPRTSARPSAGCSSA